MNKTTSVLLNVAHFLDHFFLLIFASAVGAIAIAFNVSRWEELMPYTVGAFVMFGLGSIPAGKLGDLWGRRRMMVIFFFGMGGSALLVSTTQTPMQLALALTVLGAFSAIYHPVGIPMLIANAPRPGVTIGINGLAGNLGIAIAALSTAMLVKHMGWRAAFYVPAMLCLLLGLIFWRYAQPELQTPAKRKPSLVNIDPQTARQAFWIITLTSTTGSLLFNFTTNGNAELLRQKLVSVTVDPANLGFVLAGIYAVASLAQLFVGRLLDRLPIKAFFASIVAVQILAFSLAWGSDGWWFVGALLLCMTAVFAAIPFSDALIARFIDDSMRSRAVGMRLAVSFGISSIAVFFLGPFVKAAGFQALLVMLAVIACATFVVVFWLPTSGKSPVQAS
jgi:MFS family permease